MKKYTKRMTILPAVLLVLLLGTTGCGKEAPHPNVDEGMDYIAEMNYKAAMDSFAKAQESGENERLILRGMGIAAMGQTDYAGAAEYFKQALLASNGRVQDIDFDLNYYLAACRQKLGEYAEAEEIYDAILNFRNDADAHYLRGNARLMQDNYEGARDDFDTAIALAPTNYDRLILIYEVLSENGYLQMGREYLQNALDRGTDKMSDLNKGMIRYYLGDYELAQALLESARTSVGGADAYLYLGMAYEATGDYNYAITNVYTTYLSRNSGNAEIYNQLGLCYMKQGDYESALSAFQSAMGLESVGMMQSLRYNEIAAYEHLGDFQKARTLLENYLSLYPDDETAKREYKFLSTR